MSSAYIFIFSHFFLGSLTSLEKRAAHTWTVQCNLVFNYENVASLSSSTPRLSSYLELFFCPPHYQITPLPASVSPHPSAGPLTCLPTHLLVCLLFSFHPQHLPSYLPARFPTCLPGITLTSQFAYLPISLSILFLSLSAFLPSFPSLPFFLSICIPTHLRDYLFTYLSYPHANLPS